MAFCNTDTLSPEELSCPICFEDFDNCDIQRNPKLLLCLHTYCLRCCHTLCRYDGTLQCSICRTMHKNVNVSELLDNYIINDYLRKQQEDADALCAREFEEKYRNEEEEYLRRKRLDEEESERIAKIENEIYKQQIEEQNRLAAEKENPTPTEIDLTTDTNEPVAESQSDPEPENPFEILSDSNSSSFEYWKFRRSLSTPQRVSSFEEGPLKSEAQLPKCNSSVEVRVPHNHVGAEGRDSKAKETAAAGTSSQILPLGSYEERAKKREEIFKTMLEDLHNIPCTKTARESIINRIRTKPAYQIDLEESESESDSEESTEEEDYDSAIEKDDLLTAATCSNEEDSSDSEESEEYEDIVLGENDTNIQNNESDASGSVFENSLENTDVIEISDDSQNDTINWDSPEYSGVSTEVPSNRDLSDDSFSDFRSCSDVLLFKSYGNDQFRINRLSTSEVSDY